MEGITMMCGNVHFSGSLFSVFVQLERASGVINQTGTGKNQTEALENLYFELFRRKVSIIEMETSENQRRKPMATVVCRNKGEPVRAAAEGLNAIEAVMMALVKAEEVFRQREQPKPNIPGF